MTLEEVFMDDIVSTCKIHGKLTRNNCLKGGTQRSKKQRYRCKSCSKKRTKNWRKNNPHRLKKVSLTWRSKVSKNERMRWYTIKRKFNVTKEEYEKMALNQNSLCAICKNKEVRSSRAKRSCEYLSIDHCHKTGRIRKLLCRKCNMALGLFEESIKIMESAIQYIKDFT